jgi:hypothetical protein
MTSSIRKLSLGMMSVVYGVTSAASSAAAAAGPTIPGEPVELIQASEALGRLTSAQLEAMPDATQLTDDPEMVAEAKQRAATALSPQAAPAVPFGPPTEVINQPGIAASDEGGNLTPPDTTGAIGLNHYLEPINSLVGVYDRATLTQVAQTPLINFFGFGSGNAFDPQILFDPTNQRWFYAGSVGSSALAVGWSKTADPTDLANGWCQFFANTGTNSHDFPKLGGNDTLIAIGTNVFANGRTFTNASIWAISKPPLGDVSCTPPTATVFGSARNPLLNADRSRTFTPVPANSADSSPTGFIVTAHRGLMANMLTVFHLQAGPTLTVRGGLTVNSFSAPPDAPQPGTVFLIDTSDARLTQAMNFTDPDAGEEAVWTQHAIAGGGGSVLRWYEILPLSLTLRQQGEIVSPSDFVFNGAIAPSTNGNDAAAFYNRTNATTNPSLAAQSRTSATPLGTMDPGELVLGTSVASQQDFSCNPPPGASCRWGDYTGATPDPITPGVVWGTGELLGPPNQRQAHWTTLNYAVVP